MAISHLLLRRLNCSTPLSFRLLSQFQNSLHFSSLSPAPDSTPQSPSAAKPSSLSARMSFIFEQIDEIDKDSEERDNTLQRIRAWRESNKQNDAPVAEAASEPPVYDSTTEGLKLELEKSEAFMGRSDGKKEVELVHPWPEWIELMERLLQQNYFDHRRKYEDGMMQGLGFDLSESAVGEDKRPDFSRDFRTVQAALVNFGRDRFDILRALSRNDLQLLVGYGCPSTDKKVAYSGKLLRKHVHLDEGDVCSSCSLRSSCEKAYLLTNKEDEARTIDVMRILLAYGFNPIDGSLANKSLLKMKPVKTVVRKLLHEVVKLSAVPIDPKLHPPVIKRPPPKVKQPPPPPKKRVGRDDVEMKKGDWLCPKCEFMNFAKNTVCLQCDAKRPKRQLLPGEWECPQCNFLNYRRNTVCFHCEHNRPPDTYAENQFPEKQRGSHIRMDKKPARADVSNAWNFDFDDHESDGADVATFEYADSRKLDEDFPLSQQILRESSRGHANDPERSRSPRGFEAEHSDSTSRRHGLGFNDFDEDDDDDVDSYELVSQNEEPKTSRVDFSELEADSESEDLESNESNWSQTHGRKQNRRSFSNSKDNVDFDTDDDLPIHPNWKSSHVADVKQQNRNKNSRTYGLDDEFGFSSGSEDENTRSINRGNRRAANRMDYTRGGRSKFNGSFSETDSDDHHMSYKNERQRDKQGHIRPGENRQDMNKMSYRRGGKSNFKESLYERDSDDDDSYKRESQRGRRDVRGQTRGRGGMMAEKKGSQDGGFNRSSGPKIFNRQGMNKMSYRRGGKSNFKESLYERDSDDDDSYKRESQRDRRDVRGQTRGHGGMVAEKKGSRGSDFNRSSGPKSFNRSNGKGSYGRNARDGNSSKFQGNRQGDRFDGRADSYEDEARQRRPRMNVR